MSLLTPPHSSHKENTSKLSLSLSLNIDAHKMHTSTSSTASATPTSAARNVVWSPHNSVHPLGTPAKPIPSTASMNALVKERPVRSILKRRRTPPLADATNAPEASTSKSPADVSSLQDLPEDLDNHFRTREATPEPAEPLQGNDYLVYPLSLVVKKDAKPRELIEGYSILAARLRTSVQFKTDPQPSWPLFQPLREHQVEFVECVIRDLGRARVDPIQTLACPSSDEETAAMEAWANDEDATEATGGLPSPQRSPTKPKKRGMTAAQVKYARDLCTISHAAIKLLCILLSVPATYSVFEDKQLASILNAVLQIPNADSLPTPNARKTCALAIMVLQCQRLPERIVRPACDRIALALRRGIAGELGKEGKKGSANDGLKAVHDLSVYQPSVFVPAFCTGVFLRCVLQNLLAPTLALRLQACHALGGVSWALASLPPSSRHHMVSDIVLDFVLTPAPATPTKAGKTSPSLPPRDSSIIRTLRTTAGATDATHIAQSPVWAISVIASLIVLIGSRMYTNKKACTTLLNVLKLSAKHKKPSIRHLFAISWRTLIWAWFQPDYDTLEDDGEDEKTDEEDEVETNQRRAQRDELKAKTREAYFQLLHEVVGMQTGMNTVTALLNYPSPSTANASPDDSLKRAFTILQVMATSGENDTVHDTTQILVNLLTPTTPASPPGRSHDLLARGLFSPHPTSGLLAADLSLTQTVPGSVMAAVRAIFEQFPNLDEIAPLKGSQLKKDWVWMRVCQVWRWVMGAVELGGDDDIPEELIRVWERLVVVCATSTSSGDGDEEEGEEGDAEEAVERVVDVLIGILQDKVLDFSAKSDAGAGKVPFPSSDGPFEGAHGKQTKHELKMRVVKLLFSTVKTVLSKEQLSGKPLRKLMACLLNPKNVAEWTVPRGSPAVSVLTTRKRQRTTSSTTSSSGKDVLAPVAAWTSVVSNVMSVADGEEALEFVKAFWGLDTLPGQAEQRSAVAGWDAEAKAVVWKTCVNVWRKNEGCWEGAVGLLAAPFGIVAALASPSVSSTPTTSKPAWMMSSDETNRWKEVYEYATGKALDYGVDGATVVDGIARVVVEAKESLCAGRELREASPFSTPKSSVSSSSSSSMSGLSWRAIFSGALIRVSDLLLDHLDITEARELPSSLVGLVNETMRLAYPVEKKNVSPATWMVQNMTRVIENCPGSLVGGLMVEWSEGLATWLGDELECWTDDVLDYTFFPLYQHLLLRIQTLPKDLAFLEAVSPVLESVFSSARTMPEQMVTQCREMFEQCWSLSPYAKMEEPADGWPTGVKRCLGLEVPQATVAEELESVVSTEDREEESLFTEDEAEPATDVETKEAPIVAVPATPRRTRATKKMPGAPGAAPRTPMANMNGLSHIPSPHRPRKESVDSSLPFPLSSPVSPVRRRRRTSSAASSGVENLFGGVFPPPTGLGLGLGLGLAPGLEVVESPMKRRRVSGGGEQENGEGSGSRRDKENASPMRRARRGSGSPVRVGALMSVAERIAAQGASGSTSSAEEKQPDMEQTEGRKKRRKVRDRMGMRKQERAAQQQQQQLQQAAQLQQEKARRMEREVSPADSVASTSSSRSGGSTSSDDERFVAAALIPFPSVDGQDTEEEAEGEKNVVLKKRKRTMTVDAGAAPLRRKLEHPVQVEVEAGPSNVPSKVKRVEKKTSIAASVMLSALRWPVPKTPVMEVDSDAEDPFEVEASSTTPLPALKLPRARLVSSSLPTPSVSGDESDVEEDEDENVKPSIPSSDDDPRYGQVTPHHIVSPALAQKATRVYTSLLKRSVSAPGVIGQGQGQVSFHDEVGVAPGSDDLDVEVGSSPLKKVVERRRKMGVSSASASASLARAGSLVGVGGEMKSEERVGQLKGVFKW